MRRSIHLLRSAAQLGRWGDAAPAGVPPSAWAALGRALSPSSGPQSRQFSEQASQDAHAAPSKQQQPTAAAPPPPSSRRRPPHRYKTFTPEFVGRVFIDAPLGEITGSEAAAAAAGGSGGPAPPMAEEAVTSHASTRRRHKRRFRDRAGLLSRADRQDLDAWLQAKAAAVEAFSAAAAARGLSSDALHRVLVEMHRSGGRWLLTVPGALPALHALAAYASDVESDEEAEEAPRLSPEQAAAAAARRATADAIAATLTAGTAAAPEEQPEPEGAAAGAAEEGRTSSPASFREGRPGVLRAETALECLERLLTNVGVPAGSIPQVLARCPHLLWRQPDEGKLAAVGELLGGREALAAAAEQAPGILLLSPGTAQDRLMGLALQTKCPSREELLALVAACPALLTTDAERVATSARFLGTLMPLRPYTTLISRFPALLTRNLTGILSGLRRDAPQRLLDADLELVISQQPTLLLGGSRRLLNTWRHLEEICGARPRWEAELRWLTQPPQKREEAQVEGPQSALRQKQRGGAEGGGSGEAGQESVAGSAASSSGGQAGGEDGEAPWFEEVYGRNRAGKQAAGAGPEEQQGGEPFWFHQEEKGRKTALLPGAYGTMQRLWPEGDRLRARTLARLLDARYWQLQRLRFLVEVHPDQAGRQRLLDTAMAPRASFDRRFPGFGEWFARQQPRDWSADGGSAGGGSADGGSGGSAGGGSSASSSAGGGKEGEEQGGASSEAAAAGGQQGQEGRSRGFGNCLTGLSNC